MIRIFHAELLKLRRRRIAYATGLGALVFAVVTSIAVFVSASDAPGSREGRGTTVDSLGRAGGATEAFASGMSFAGILVMVLFIANFAGEGSQGTFRALLMRQPQRLALLAGKMGALLAFLAAVLLLTELLTVAVSTAFAGTQDVSTTSWFGSDGLGEAAGDFATAMLGLSAWAAFGMALAIFVRSIPVALAIGVVWSGPIEHLAQDAWNPAGEWFPGLLLEDIASGSSPDLAWAGALVGLYVVAAVGVAGAVFSRRDVTS